MARRDGLAALAMLLVAGAALYESAQLPFGAVRNPGPGFVPWWTALALGALSVVLGLGAVRAAKIEAPRERPGRGRRGQVLGLLAALALYVAALDPVGYPISTFLLVLLMLRPMARARPVLALGLAVLAAGGSFVVFGVWLKVPLPPGPLAR